MHRRRLRTLEPLMTGSCLADDRSMVRSSSNDWLTGTDRRPPALVLLVIVLALGVAAVDLVLMLNGG